jgi:hypothetical protein
MVSNPPITNFQICREVKWYTIGLLIIKQSVEPYTESTDIYGQINMVIPFNLIFLDVKKIYTSKNIGSINQQNIIHL